MHNLDQVGSVAWGIDCGQGIPAIYSAVPDAMCWIDMIMTCVPLGTADINNEKETEGIVFNLRAGARRNGDGVPSVNGLRVEECGRWRKQNGALPEMCDIVYQGENR